MSVVRLFKKSAEWKQVHKDPYTIPMCTCRAFIYILLLTLCKTKKGQAFNFFLFLFVDDNLLPTSQFLCSNPRPLVTSTSCTYSTTGPSCQMHVYMAGYTLLILKIPRQLAIFIRYFLTKENSFCNRSSQPTRFKSNRPRSGLADRLCHVLFMICTCKPTTSNGSVTTLWYF